ncbi:MAG: Fur family transcriptional regulator [Thermoleophilaceae bacterium]
MSAKHRHSTARSVWAEHARDTLKHRGYSRGGAREAVIEFLDHQPCATSAQDIYRALRERGRSIAMASVYRSLEALHGLDLVQRLEVGHGESLYEPLPAGGEHHHHVVCDTCDRIVPFEDPALERAISRLTERVPFEIAGHDVVLHGLCPDCRDAPRG